VDEPMGGVQVGWSHWRRAAEAWQVMTGRLDCGNGHLLQSRMQLASPATNTAIIIINNNNKTTTYIAP